MMSITKMRQAHSEKVVEFARANGYKLRNGLWISPRGYITSRLCNGRFLAFLTEHGTGKRISALPV